MISRGTVRKMRQNLGWAIGYNSLGLPIAAGVFGADRADAAARDRRDLDGRLERAGRGSPRSRSSGFACRGWRR
jgi:hypothetical protein